MRTEEGPLQAVAGLAEHAQERDIPRIVQSEGRGATHSAYVFREGQSRWIDSNLARLRFISDGEPARANVSHEILDRKTSSIDDIATSDAVRCWITNNQDFIAHSCHWGSMITNIKERFVYL